MRQWINLAEALRPTHAMVPPKIEGIFSYIILHDPDEYPDDNWIENSETVVFDLAPWMYEAPSEILMLLFKDELGCSQDIIEHYAYAANPEIKDLMVNCNSWVGDFDVEEARAWVRAKRPEVYEEFEAFSRHEGEIFEALKPKERLKEALRPVGIAPPEVDAYLTYITNDVEVEDGADLTWSEHGNNYHFDATPWLRMATFENIKACVLHMYSLTKTTMSAVNGHKLDELYTDGEEIAQFCADYDADLKTLLENAHAYQAQIDAVAAVKWLRAYRPEILEQANLLNEALKPHHSKPILEWRPTIEGNYQLEEVNPEDHHAGLYEEWGFIYDLGGSEPDLPYFEWAALERGTGALLANGNTNSLNEAMRAVEAVHGLPECHLIA